jgi:molybdopterin molybdotransferase
MSDLLSVSEAQRFILKDFKPTEPHKVALGQASRRILAEDIFSPLDLPPFANSSMDGFAVHSSDVASAAQENPVLLTVVADIPAGMHSMIQVAHGQAARIMTGAPLPIDCDAVVPVENTRFESPGPYQALPDTVAVLTPARPGDSIRPVGQDVHKGDLIMTRGTWLGPQQVGMLAMLGYSQVVVHRPPRIALFSSGDELVPVGTPLEPGKIYDSNTLMLVSMVEKYSAEVVNLGIAPDDIAAIRKLLDRAVSEKVDLILSSAGVSVGSYDYIRSLVQADGEITLWRVNMRPGKPLTYGSYTQIPFIGLPGNPVSAYMGFEIFVRPVLMKLQGRLSWQRPMIQVEIEEAIESDGRESYLRAIVRNQDGAWRGKLIGHQGSGNLRSLVQANALLLIPSEVKSLPVGARVDGWLLDE